MLRLQARGCHNINCVTPTHYLPHILLALDRAASRGLRLPLVYNTSGWERRDILEILDGAVDIYLPDFKFWDPEAAARYSPGAGSENYPETARDALLEMHRQAGRALPAEDGLIERGLMIRHLVMPNRVAGTREVLGWIARHLPKDTYVNLMAQYRPFYKAFDYPEIARPLTEREYRECVEWVREFGLSRVCLQA
jgi:putative pyruvate formate lyase activating enzyme